MQYPIEPFVVSGEGVLTPPGRDRWVTKEMYKKAGERPNFTAQEVGEVFFGKSTVWLRKRLSERYDRFEPNRTDSNHRRFGLHQIEDFAHMLLEDEAISPLQFTMVIRMIKSSAVLNLYEIGDSGFLQGHWNGAQRERRLAITHLMTRLEELDAGRPRKLLIEAAERAISEAADAIRRAETFPLEELT
jgi:hypothetical protein